MPCLPVAARGVAASLVAAACLTTASAIALEQDHHQHQHVRLVRREAISAGGTLAAAEEKREELVRREVVGAGGALSTDEGEGEVQAPPDVILHAFNWKYSDVAARAGQIKAAGYGAVLVAPAYLADGGAWWSLYQPIDYRVIKHFGGDTNDFKNMVNALKATGVKVYADVILNHMAGLEWKRPDKNLDYPGWDKVWMYGNSSTYYNSIKLFGKLTENFIGKNDFNPAGCITDWNNVWQVQNWRLCSSSTDPGMPDLNGNSWVVSQQRAYLQALQGMGVAGFRIDAAKHMTPAHVNAVLSPDLKANMFVFGEIITNGGTGTTEYDRFLSPYLTSTGHRAYDFPLLATIRSAFSMTGSLSNLANPQGSGQALPWYQAVTFALTHDIPNNDGFRYQIMDPVDEMLAYAYIMGRDGGVPMVYSDNGESTKDGTRWINAFNKTENTNMIRFHNAVLGLDMQVLSSNQCYILFRRGNKGIVGINKCGSTAQASVIMANSVVQWNVNYFDTMGSKDVVKVTGTPYVFNLPARTARMWLC